MKDEIKEILDEMKQICDVWVIMEGGVKTYNQDQIHCIYDYITNLEQENSEQLDENLKQSEWLVKKQKRIEKAIEYIKFNLDKNAELIQYFNYDANFNKLLDILNGGDE